MPALELFGRRWRVATDDFVFLGFFDLILTVIWIIVSVVVFFGSDSSWTCEGKANIRTYAYGIFSSLNLVAILSSLLVHYSKAGSITDTHSRRLVPYCLYARVFLQIFGILWNVLGSIWIVNGSLECSTVPYIVGFIKGYVLYSWIFFLISLVGVAIVYDPFGGSCRRKSDYPYQSNGDNLSLSQIPESLHTQVWRRRLRWWLLYCFSTSSSSKIGIYEAGKLCGAMFEDTDLAPSDVLAGLLLLRLEYKNANRDEIALVAKTCDPGEDSVTTQPKVGASMEQLFRDDWTHPRLLSHFLHYARAAYAWPLVVFENKPHAVRRLCAKAFFCHCLPGRQHPLKVVDDDWCFCHSSGTRNLLEDRDPFLIHLCFTNSVFKTPFFLAKDTATKTIVVSIRGTMSKSDILTDMTGWPVPIDSPGLPSSFKGHHGMVLCAKAMRDRLEELNIIPELLRENPGYQIVFTGTSLGAATATILGAILKEKYPFLKCYAFSPPGGLLSEDAAEWCSDFTTSILYGNDVVPRLSIRSIQRLKISLINAITRSTTPKYEIILGALTMFRGKRRGEVRRLGKGQAPSPNPGGNQHDVIHMDGEGALDFTPTSCSSLTCLSHNTPHAHSDTSASEERKWTPCQETRQLFPCVEMYLPGRILYITETPHFPLGHRKSSDIGSSRWRIRWATRSEFQEIIINGRAIGDHLPYRMYKALKVLASSNVHVPQTT